MDTRRLEKALVHTFDDRSLLTRALTHRSAGADNNERLEFLGDAILGMRIADLLFQRQSHADEGQLSRMRAHLVKRETLAEIARQLELNQYLVLGAGELRSGGASRDSTLADAVEALIAAVYLDAGLQRAMELIDHLFLERLQRLPAEARQKDPKTRLQEFLQSRGVDLPEYQVQETRGQQHQQTFTVLCRVEALDSEALGEGSSRRKAEQKAARNVLRKLGEET